MSRILITGAAGFLGSRLAPAISRIGSHDIRLHMRRAPDRPGHPPASDLTSIVAANLLQRERLPMLVDGVDIVIHAAAAKRGAAADMFLNSVVGTRNLLEAAVAAGCRRFVLVSSFAAFRTSELRAGDTLDEHCPSEPTGIEKGAYGFSKVQQELLVRDYQQRHGFELVVLRPGVIYGPGETGISPRVGLQVGPLFFALGGSSRLPLTYVDNCADAIAWAALHAPPGATYPVVDDELPTCRQFLRRYRREVRDLRTVPVPRWAFALGARALTAYSRRSLGQLPAVFTPYILRSMYRPLRYSNEALKQIGWRQATSTDVGLRLAMNAMKAAR